IRIWNCSIPHGERTVRTISFTDAEYSIRRSDSDGRATFECVPSNAIECNVEIKTAAYGVQSIVYRVTGSQDPIRLRPVARLTGRIVVDEPALVAGTKFWLPSYPPRDTRRLTLTDSRRTLTQGWARFEIDEMGRFEVPALAVGRTS